MRKEQGRIFAESQGDFDFEEAVEALQRVFGIVGICPVLECDDLPVEELAVTAIDYMNEVYPEGGVHLPR